MSNAQPDTTLADYLRVLKQRKLFIIAVALICTAAALGVSLIQKKSYDATASEVVKDPNQDLLSLGRRRLQHADTAAARLRARSGRDTPGGAGGGQEGPP